MYRTLFLSDIHLGKHHCHADLLLEFLHHHEAETIYLVGDVFDVWCLRKKMYWPPSHDQVFRHLVRRAETGTRVIYLPGNHDDILRRSRNLSFGPIEFTDSAEHRCADGRRYLVIHGDQYDVVLQKANWLGPIGDWFYDVVLTANKGLGALWRRTGRTPAWSLSAIAKQMVKRTVNYASHFEDVVVAELEAKRLDGIICGHVHHAEDGDMRGFHYVNTGDWVESCTAVVEHYDGRLEILTWSDAVQSRAATAAIAAKQAAE
ncbi:UDP-2,3-diacylglucosamine diphosphatase [Aestuariivita sp.]|jgi:UDP-2,3-diacylglucosamine pyrophosphatase LpxH|uniref:UDP-2,3-diacylglucosamine diphosphatase n=1 Tax=Aestuariivita sp. TaxID=1872407 RepID=UPI002171883F|nr:UDP-2,3-diacylglucosamine diphosphatase [Aestuariivita sp.]MCE8009012.1 UDP-2,3-diacylglucosamine diphosphatase [Aestuariivita sp.]